MADRPDGTVVTEPSKAVFLSYASQDGKAAQRLCAALRDVDRAYLLRDVALTSIRTDPCLKSLQADQRYTQMLKKLNLS
jgi:hypothetical protein